MSPYLVVDAETGKQIAANLTLQQAQALAQHLANLTGRVIEITTELLDDRTERETVR